MDLNYPEEWYSKSSSEENNDDDMGIGRSYECIFCKRGFTTAQALGGHMNIHRKERANKSKPTFSSSPPSSSSNKVVDDGIINCNYPDLTRFYSQILPTTPHHAFFPATAQSVRPSSHGHQVFFVENQRDHDHHVFAQDWRKTTLSLYSNPLCFHEIKDKFEESEENGLDLELRLGHHHP